MPPDPQKVLILTGGLFSLDETSWTGTLRRQVAAMRAAGGGWIDLHLKLVAAERVSALRAARSRPGWREAPWREAVERLDQPDPFQGVPELTEVVLATLLRDAGLTFEVATCSELHLDPARRAALLASCGVIFASTTLVRDLSELKAMLGPIKRPDNLVVAGGALVGMLHEGWTPIDEVDLLAVGWGERLVPALAAWLRGGRVRLEPPPGGRLERRGTTPCLIAGLPEGRSLDALPRPDWSLAEQTRGRALPAVHYESVRGCPYRCAFCNYPFLFDDTQFRVRSAEAIAEDWALLAARGVRRISCLDSLFTMPRRRLIELCQIMLQRNIAVEWVCYARADDLRDREVVRLMKDAGCRQVQIGYESGSPLILANMNKRSTPEANARALDHCRAEGLTTLITLIVGFPGETRATLDETEAAVRASPPDFFFIAPFSTKFRHIPVLAPEARRRFGLVTREDGWSAFPPWRHHTMHTLEAIEHVHRLNHVFMRDRVALEGGIFYGQTLHFRPEDRAALLAFQARLALDPGPAARLTAGLRRLSRRPAEAELRRDLARASAGADPALAL